MRDGINLARRGLPVVVFVHDNFERAARAQLKVSGLPDLRLCVYPQYQPGKLTAELETAKAQKVVEELQKLLLE